MAAVWKNTLEALRKDASFRNMFHMMEQYGKNVASEMTDSTGNKLSRSYSEVVERSCRACGAVERLAGEGEIVGLIYETCMDWPVLFWGILMAGKIPLLLNPGSDRELLKTIMAEAGASVYVAGSPLENCTLPFLDAQLLLRAEAEPYTEHWGRYVALCTSGTTGNSRIFLYDGETIAAHILSFDEAKQLNPDMPFIEGRPCKLLAFLPFHHVFGLSVVYLLYSCTGKTLVYLPEKSAQAILSTCREHGVTHLYCIPMFFNLLADGIRKKLCDKDTSKLPALAKYMIRKKTLGTQIRSMITGGGHIPQSTLELLNDIGFPLCNGFGMTETGIIAVEKSLDPKQRIRGSIGYPFAITEWRLSGGKEGELLLRGPALYSASIVNGAIVPRDGAVWFSTGDVVSDRGDGLYISGRVKDVIIGANGENIYPEELEERFSKLDAVHNYCILGIRNGVYEDVAIVLEPAESFDAAAATKQILQVNGKLPLGERVVRAYVSDIALPVSGNMKVKRLCLKQKIEAGEWPCESVNLYTGEVRRRNRAADPYESSQEYKQLLGEIRALASEALDTKISEEDDEAHFVGRLGANSLQVFSLFSSIEEKYGVEIANTEFPMLENCRITAKVIYCKQHDLPSPVGVVNEAEPEAKETRRITNFAESEEYRAIKARMKDTFRDGVNPYFIPHDSVIRDTSVINGKEMINLGSYNYLGMSGNPETELAAIDAILKYGTSASGSRTLAGEKTIYRKLEQTIADWKHTEDAIVCTGGWATNLSFVSCFAKKGDYIVYDILSHNSLTEGVKLSEADSKAFEHNNLKQLETILQRAEGKYNKVLIIVEGVYSMDGDIAPIPAFVALKKKYGAFLMVDEAHSGCVIGDWGGGVDDYFHLDPKDIDIKYGTLSKGLGACGGYIAADASIVEYLRYQMNGFVFTAGIAPPLAAEVIKAIELIRRDNSMVTQLHKNIAYFVRRAKEEGLNIGLAGQSAIVPVMVGADIDAARISAKLMERGVFVPPAMYPAVPMGESRLRFTVSATHNFEQLEKAVTETARVMREEGILK